MRSKLALSLFFITFWLCESKQQQQLEDLWPFSIEPRQFVSDCFEKKVCLFTIHPNYVHQVFSIFSSNDLDNLLTQNLSAFNVPDLPQDFDWDTQAYLKEKDWPPLHYGEDLKLAKRVKKDDEYWSGMLPLSSTSLENLHKAFSYGFTLILNRMNFRVQEIHQLALHLGNLFSSTCDVNLYMTPSTSPSTQDQSTQGFEAHIDMMDSFIFQLEGEKTWKIYDSPIPLPLFSQKFKPKLKSLNNPSTITLRPGHVLYVPRGLIHEAFVTNQPSLHLTFGLNTNLHYLSHVFQVAISFTDLNYSEIIKFLTIAWVERLSSLNEDYRKSVTYPLIQIPLLQPVSSLLIQSKEKFASDYQKMIGEIIQTRVKVDKLLIFILEAASKQETQKDKYESYFMKDEVVDWANHHDSIDSHNSVQEKIESILEEASKISFDKVIEIYTKYNTNRIKEHLQKEKFCLAQHFNSYQHSSLRDEL